VRPLFFVCPIHFRLLSLDRSCLSAKSRQAAGKLLAEEIGEGRLMKATLTY
jgi:hypothetical protein